MFVHFGSILLKYFKTISHFFRSEIFLTIFVSPGLEFLPLQAFITIRIHHVCQQNHAYCRCQECQQLDTIFHFALYLQSTTKQKNKQNSMHPKNKYKTVESSELPQLKASQKLKQLRQLRIANPEKAFDLRTTNMKLPSYDALSDRHLRTYFGQETVRRHIKKMSTLGNSSKNLSIEPRYDSVRGQRRGIVGREQFLNYLSGIRARIVSSNHSS